MRESWGRNAGRGNPLPEDIVVDEQDVTRLILEHLHRRGHITAMRALEKEAGVEAEHLGDGASFLRGLVLDARWHDAAQMVQPLRPGTPEHERACFELRKQEFLEMLEGRGLTSDTPSLVKALHRLKTGSTLEEFNDLCYCLTLPDLRTHPQYARWTPHQGRLTCFEALRGCLTKLFPDDGTVEKAVPNGQLELLCQQACLFQAEERRRKNADTVFPRRAIGGILSKTWAPKAALDTANGERGGSGERPAHTAPAGLLQFSQKKRRDSNTAAAAAANRVRRLSKSQPLGWMLSCVGGGSFCAPGSFEGVDDYECPSPGTVSGDAYGMSGGQKHQRTLTDPLMDRLRGGGGGGGGVSSWWDSVAAASCATASPEKYGEIMRASNGAVFRVGANKDTTSARPSTDPAQGFPTLHIAPAFLGGAVNGNATRPSDPESPGERMTPEWARHRRLNSGDTGSSRSSDTGSEEDTASGSLSSSGSVSDSDSPSSSSASASGSDAADDRPSSSDDWVRHDRGSPRAQGKTVSLPSSARRRRRRRRRRRTPGELAHGEHGDDTGAAVCSERTAGATHDAKVRKDRSPGGKRGGGETTAGPGEPREGHGEGSGPSPRQRPVAWDIPVSTKHEFSPNAGRRRRSGDPATDNPGFDTGQAAEEAGGLGRSAGTVGSISSPWPEAYTSAADAKSRAPSPEPSPPAAGGPLRRRSQPASIGSTARASERRQVLSEGGGEGNDAGLASLPLPLPRLGEQENCCPTRSDEIYEEASHVRGKGQGREEMSTRGNSSRRRGSSFSPERAAGGGAAEAAGAVAAAAAIPDDLGGSRNAFDRVSEEEAPRFVPTVVLRASHPIRSVGFSPAGSLFAAGSNDRTLRVCRSPSEADIASAKGDARSRLRVLESTPLVQRDDLHRGSIYCLAFSPDSAIIATGSNDKLVRVLPVPDLGDVAPPENGRSRSRSSSSSSSNYNNGTRVPAAEGLYLRGHTGTVRDLCFRSPGPGAERGGKSRSYSDQLLTAGAGDFACRVWDLQGGVAVEGGSGDTGGLQPTVIFRGHTDTVFSVNLLPGGQVALTGGADSVVRVWDARTGGSVRSLVVEGKEVLCVRPWPGDPERVVETSHSDGYCFLWDIRTGHALSSSRHHTDQTRALDFSPNGHALLTASYDGLVGICACRGPGMTTKTTPGAAEAALTTTGAAAAGAATATAASDSGAASVQRPLPAASVSVSVLAMLRAHGGRVLQARWRPTGPPAFLTSSTDCTVLLWSIQGQ